MYDIVCMYVCVRIAIKFSWVLSGNKLPGLITTTRPDHKPTDQYIYNIEYTSWYNYVIS